MKTGGQHEAPVVRRTEDMEMAMEDRDLLRVFEMRNAEEIRKKSRENIQQQILMEMERKQERRWETIWGITCDIAAAGAGGCFVAAVMRQDILLFLAAAAIFAASRCARREAR